MRTIAFLLGFTALVYEIFSFKILFTFVPENLKASALALSAFLGGIAVSTAVVSKLKFTEKNRSGVLASLQTALAVFAVVVLPHYDLAALYLADEKTRTLVVVALIWLILFIPALFLGSSLPLYIKDVSEKKEGGDVISKIYFWDVTGSVAGVLLAAFVLIPQLGLRGAVYFNATLNAVLAVLLANNARFRIAIAAVALFFAGLIFMINPRVTRLPLSKFGNVIFEEDTVYGTVRVGRDVRYQGNKVLFINYRDMCHSGQQNP
jgi:predicted membrane-bound spermidine synthase